MKQQRTVTNIKYWELNDADIKGIQEKAGQDTEPFQRELYLDATTGGGEALLKAGFVEVQNYEKIYFAGCLKWKEQDLWFFGSISETNCLAIDLKYGYAEKDFDSALLAFSVRAMQDRRQDAEYRAANCTRQMHNLTNSYNEKNNLK